LEFFSDVDIEVDDNHDGTFSIYYTVKDAGEYTLSVKFGGQPVPDGFYTFTVNFLSLLKIPMIFQNVY
jgi:filamin